MKDLTTKIFEAEIDKLNDSFFQKDIIKDIISNINNLLDKRELLLSNGFDLKNYTVLENYLNAYYKFLLSFHTPQCEIISYTTTLLRELLNIDYNKDKHCFELYSPLMLNIFYRYYKLVEQYESMKISNSRLFKHVCKNMIECLISNSNYFTLDSNEKIALTKPIITSTNSTTDGNLNLYLPIRNLSETTSFFDLSKINIAEKITHELNNYILYRNFEVTEFTVAILGTIDIDTFKENLTFYIPNLFDNYGNIKDKLTNLKIVIDIYSLENKEYIENFQFDLNICTNCTIELKNSDSFKTFFKSSKFLVNLYNSHNVVFLLDCVDMYSLERETQNNLTITLQGLFLNTFSGEYGISNNLDKLYELMSLSSKDTRVFEINRHLFNDFFKYIDSLIKKSQNEYKFCTTYTYFSISPGFLDSNRFYTDVYNYKEFIVHRISTYNEEIELPCKNKYGKYITLNMLDIIRKFNLSEIYKDKKLEELHHTYLYLDYSKGINNLKLVYENNISKEFAENILLPFLNYTPSSNDNLNKKNFFTNNIRKVCSSLLYDNAQSIQDMIIVHIFKNNSLNIDLMSNDNKRFTPKIQKYTNSNKDYIQHAINTFDVSSIDSFPQSDFYCNHIENYGRDGFYDLLNNIAEACIPIYQDSYLYRNCNNIYNNN